MLTELDIARFKQDGFLLLKGVFSANEINRFRSIGGTIDGAADLSALPGLESLWSDERLVGIAKRLLGEPVTFFGEASYLRVVSAPGEHVRGRHLHHDAKGTPVNLFNRQHAPTPEPYPIIRFAIYMQDHAAQSGGLKLVPGSHQFDSSTFDEGNLSYFNIPTEPGDLVVFCNKILHSPYALRLRNDPQRGLSPIKEDSWFAKEPAAFLPFPEDRQSIFIDFSGGNDLADIYIKGRALHPKNARTGFVNEVKGGRLLEDAQRVGVRIRLDAAVVEAVTMVSKTAVNRSVSDAGAPYLMALPQLCRLSRPWSPHYNFIPDIPDDDTMESAFNLLRELLIRIDRLRESMRAATKDVAMFGRYKFDKT